MQIQKSPCRPCEAARLAAAQRASGNFQESPETFPLPDFGLLGPLKRSHEYASIRRRVAEPMPIDAWQMDLLHYFIFQLRPDENAPAGEDATYALFTMRWEDDGPVSALIITPDTGGG